jgi:hypothetical protein
VRKSRKSKKSLSAFGGFAPLSIPAEAKTLATDVVQGKIHTYPRTPEAAPIKLKAKGKRILTWKEYNGYAGPLPHSPAEALALIPYDASVLRIAEIPEIRKENT